MKGMKLLLIITVLLFSTFCIDGIGLNPIKPYHLNKGKLTKYLFSLQTEQEITSKAKIKVTFPAEFDQSTLASNPSCMANSDSFSWKTVPCSYITDSIILNLGSIKDEKMNILIESPRNPVIYSMSSYFSICLMFDNSINSCKRQFGKVVFPTAPITTATTPLLPNVTSLSSVSVGKASTYQFKFSTSVTYSTGNTIRVTFPPGYTTTGNPVCQMTGTYNQIIKTFVWPNQRSIECQLVNKTISTDQVLKIIGIYNPSFAGTFGNSADGFIIQILEGTTTVVLEQLYVQMTVQIEAGELSANIVQSNRFIKSKSRYTFYLNLQNSLSSTDQITIKMLKSWVFYQNECSVVSGITLGSDNKIYCLNSTDATFAYLKINNFVSASTTNQLVFNVFVGTPLTIGTYDVSITTSNPNGILDAATLSVSLNETYGSLDMLSINAITSNAKVAVGQTGPLQLTFFLNYELPQTNVLTTGVMYLKIYPQIPTPPPLTNGVLKCYFFNTIPATTCTWDVSNALYTLVTIKTPDTLSFQYSQIPITITTEGAINPSKIGITIADKVTRYRFELSAYKQDSLVTPTQVYYSEYIADAIQIPTITCRSLTKQVNEETAVRIDFTNPYSFSTPLLDNIRFKIEFLSGGGWATNLGYDADKIYKRFPCVFYYNSAAYDSHVNCDLYTYLSGPHASLSESSVRGPYILMYGFTNPLSLGQTYRIELAKFLIGSSTGTDTKIRFSIIEETPDMLTKYIELYYYEVTLFTTVSQQIATASTNAVTITPSNSLINVATTHTNTFTTSSNAYALTYQYDRQSTPSFTNKLVTCTGSNKCVYFGYPVNWIIEYAATSIPVSVSSSISMTNGIYGGTYAGVARAYSSSSLIIFKSTFNTVYSPNTIATAYFQKLGSNTLYKGADVYYSIYFDAIAPTQANSMIRFTFGSGVTLSSQPYCSSSIGLYVAEHGLRCVNEVSNTVLKIYNLAALSAGSRYTFTVRLKSDLTTGSTIRPTVTIRTYYSYNVDYSVIDQKVNHLLAVTENNYQTIPNDFSIESPKVTTQIPRVGYIGSFIARFRPSSASLTSAKIIMELPNHSWNSGYWSTPNQLASDPLVCFINTQRVACTYTLSPLRVTMTAQNLISGSDNKITITTEYLKQNGIKHPAQGGDYICTLTFLDSSNAQIQSTSFYHRVLPPRLRTFWVTSAVNDIGVENMFTFQMQIGSVQPRSYSDGTKYARILLEFPTVDALGNSLFAADLGGYTKNGEYVGCYMYPYTNPYVDSDTDNLRCRLIKSQVAGQPAIVEVLNCGAFSGTQYRMKIRVARIYNPSRAVVSIPISMRINHVTVGTNDIQQLYYDTFDVFMNSQNPAPLADTTRSCSEYSTDFAENGPEIGDLAYIRFYPRKKDSSTSSYFYVIKLPLDFVPANRQFRGPASCSSSYHSECMAFPDINYLIIDTFSDNYIVQMYTYLPKATSQVNYNIAVLVWQGNRFKGTEYITINSACQDDFDGTLVSYGGISEVGSGNQNHPNRRRHQVKIDFTLRHVVPVGGTIQVVWPSSVTAAYPHCRSMTNLGSQLYAQGGTYNGEIGCSVQSGNTWVITQFQQLPTSGRVILMGYVDIAGSSSNYLGASEIISYNSTHATNIRSNGFLIDYRYDSNSDIYLTSYSSMNIDTQISLQQTLPLRINYVGPLQFKFRLASSFPGPNQGKIRIRLPRKSVYGFSGGFSYDSTKKIVCQLQQILTFEEYGCIVTSVTDDTTSGSENILLQIISSSTLVTSSTYKIKIQTHTGVDPQGLIFPSAPGIYKIDVSFDVDSSSQYNIHDHLYLQVYGTPFTLLSVQSFVTLCNTVNLIWVKLTPTTTIGQNDQIVVQIPTKGSNGWTLYANDLGTGIADGGDIPFDVITGDFSNSFMNCRLFRGDQTYGKSARVVCGGFTSSITSSQLLHFGFKVVNPSVSPQMSIPFFIYSYQTNTMYKSNFNTVQRAVYLRNTLLASGYDQPAQITSGNHQLQTQTTYIEFTARNQVTTTSEDYYALFFAFPLRNNGKITNGCKSAGGGTTFGHAYYHRNLWIIVCDFTINNLGTAGSGYVSRTLRIQGFYTPWYYLGGSQTTIYTYHLYSYEYSYSGILSDGFPQMNPKTTSTATFTLTPIHQTSTMYKGSRDDYTISFTYSSSSSIDISYMKLIAIIFPNPSDADFLLIGRDCMEAPTSSIEIAECWIVPNTRIIWIRPVQKASYTSNMNIAITTRDLAIRNPTNTGTVYKSWFTIKFYSYENITEPALDPINNNYYCYLIINSLPATTWSYSNNPTSIAVGTFSYLNIPYQRYYKETPFNSLTHYAPFEFIFRPDNNFPTLSGLSYHKLQVTFGTIFTENAQFKLRDLQVFRPVCYLANNRIRKCSLDTTNNVITMSFQFSLSVNTNYHVLFSLTDPRSPDTYGFLPSLAVSSIVVNYVLSGSSTKYYTQTDKFPTLYSLPTGATQGPFRGILAGVVQYGHATQSQLNVLNLRLTFNRTDITGLVIQIPLIDSQGNYLYTSAAAKSAAFLDLEDGSTYPCGNNGLGASGNVKCFLKIGAFGDLTSPTRIVMTDFSYDTSMNCRFIFRNPETVNSYFSVKVKAFGGTKSSTNLYGDKYMGQWDFSNIFQTQSHTPASNSYDVSATRLPSKSPWRQSTIYYVFSRNENLGAGRMSIAELLEYDSGISYTDKQICISTLGLNNDYDDLLQYTKVVSGRIYRYSYFVRTWPSTTNLRELSTGGWGLTYVKCKFYYLSITAYWFFGDTSIQIATNTFTPSNGYPLEIGTNPTNVYFDHDYRLADGTATKFVFQLNLTPMIKPLLSSDLSLRNNDNLVISITFSYAYWSSISSCNLLGGVSSTSMTQHAYCSVISSTVLVIRNIKNFQTDPLLSITSNMRLKVLFRVASLTSVDSSTTRQMTVKLFSNYDAFTNNYQAIVRGTTSFSENCYYPALSGTCWVTHTSGGGPFLLQKVTDTFMQVTFGTRQNLGFGGTNYNHVFHIKFNGFNYGSSCSISNVVLQISTSTTPGSGFNNTLAPTSMPCTGSSITINYNNLIFNTIWGAVAGTAAYDNTFATNQYIIFYITIAPGSDCELPALHHQYIFAVGVYNHQLTSNGAYDWDVRTVAALPTQSLASSFVISTISQNRDGVTQFIMDISTLSVGVGSNKTGYIFLAEVIGGTSWTGSNDPFASYVNTAIVQEQIQCKCIAALTISVTTTTSYVDASCQRRLPVSGGFNAYSILIDVAANPSQSVRCYFPQFKIFSGMSFSMELKTIYGNSYPPDLTNGNQYGSMYRKTSNTLNFAGSSPSMTLTGMNSLSQTNFYPSAATIGTTFGSTYSITGSWSGGLTNPYIYVNYRKAGPVPATTFCADSVKYLQCRVYTRFNNLIVAKSKQTGVTTFTMSRGNADIYYPSSQWSDSSVFGAVVYIGTTQWLYSGGISRTQSNLAPISSNTFLVYSDLYGSSRSTFSTIITMAMGIGGKTLFRYLDTGSKLVVTFSGISTQKSSCQIWVQNEPNIELTCIVGTGIITIYSERSDYSTSNLIFVEIGITNPTTTPITFTMNLYSYYYSASRYALVVSKSTTYAIDTTWSSQTRITKERVFMMPFESRITMLPNAPFRIRFKLTSSIAYNPTTPSYSGMIRIINAQIGSSTSFIIYFREYTTFSRMIQQTQYTEAKANSWSVSSTTLDIIPPKSMTINSAFFYQLIIMPLNINLVAGCCASQSGFQQVNFELITIIAYSNPAIGPSVVNTQVQRMYKNEGQSRLILQQIYVLCAEPTETSLYFKFKPDFTSTNNYPNHYLEFIFWDLPPAAFTGYSLKNQIPCQLSSNFLSIPSRQAPACVLSEADNLNGFVKIRVINIGTITAENSYWITLDDIILPTPSSAGATNKFDMSLIYMGPSNVRYESFYREVFLIDNTDTTNTATLSISFPDPSIRQFGTSNVGSLNFNWPFDTTTSGYESKVSFNFNGGFSAIWPNIDSINFLDVTGTYQILWVNKKLKKFVLAVPQKSISTATVLNISGIVNPYPYQSSLYSATNTMQVNFYNNYMYQSTQTYNQPQFSIYTKNVAIVNIDQNLPSNSLDTYPTTNRIGNGATTILRLGVVIEETSANILQRDLSILQIQFNSGVTYIDDCRIVRNSSIYANPKSTCQVLYTGGKWNVMHYHFKESQLNTYWWVQIVGKFSSTSVNYACRLKATNGVIQYESTYTISLSSYYSTSKSIPTTLSWLNRKYIYNFFENQVRYLQAVSGQSTPYFRMRITIPLSYDGSSDYTRIYLRSTTYFTSLTSSTNLICQFLPAVSAEKDFSVGYYGECYKSSQGNGNHFYHIIGPYGGYSNGDYLLQISEPNVVTTSFRGPTAPAFHSMDYEQVVNGGSTYTDAMDFQFKQFFTSVQILHTTTTVNDYDTLTITYTPKISVSAGSSNTETVLMLDISGLYHENDAGIKSVYTADGKTFETGGRFSEVVGNPNGNQVTTLKFSQYSQKMAPIRFALAKQSAYSAGTAYTWRIPLIKNPSVAFTALRYNLTLIQYQNGADYGIIMQQHECINEYYTQADTSTSFNPSITNLNRNVQVTSAIDLAINLDSYSLAQWDSVVFKLDNSYLGLIPNFLAGNDTSNYFYYYFHTINMILAQKKTTNVVTNVGIGGLSSTINYQRQFKFSWVKVHDSSNAPTTGNPKTLKTGNPPSLLINYLTSYSAASITRVEGVENQGSTAMYRLDVTVPIIPLGGQIQINFDSTKISSNSGGRCRVRTGFTRSTDPYILRCFMITGGFKITGFTAISTATPLSIYFMVTSLAALNSQNIAVNLYGIFGDSTSSISKKANTVTITHTAGSYPSVLAKFYELTSYYYSSVRSENFYELEGNLNLRNNNIVSGEYIKMINPLSYDGHPRLLIRRNDSNYIEWIQLTPSSVSSSQINFYLPSVYLTNFTLIANTQYIWKYTAQRACYYNSAREDGFIPQSSGNEKFWYQGYHSGAITQSQYYDFISDPYPRDLTINNRYRGATQKTALEFSFYIDVSVNAGDWIEMTFDTNNLIADMFANDIQNNPVTDEVFRFLDCRETGSAFISSGRMRCIVYYGDNTANPPKPARLVIPLELSHNFWTWPNTIKFMLANVRNPTTVGMNVGVQMNVMRDCTVNINKNCSILAARGWYVTTSNVQNVQTTTSSFTPSSNNILDTGITHTFQFQATASIGTNDVIYIVYPENFQGVMPSTCSASNYNCYAFPKPRWIVLIPTTTVIGSSGTLTISLTTYMNNAYYLQAYTQNIVVTVSRGSGGNADVYNILQNPFITIKRSTTSNTATQMVISTTQTPNIWLRNYANTAIFQLDNLFMDSRITAIYLKAPAADVLSWDINYCNASLTSTQINTYPLRFTCRVFVQDTSTPVLQIIPEPQDLANYAANANSWDDLTVKVHAKFTIAPFGAGQPILYTTTPVTSSTFNAYGSINATSDDSKYFLSQCSNTISISQHQVPIISDITFNQQSFAYRVARVGNKQVFYLLLKPTVSIPITQMNFIIPVEFDYPGVFQHDDCFMIGRTKEDQNYCKQSRQGGRTIIKVVPENYNNQVKIIQLGSISQSNWFTAPSLPGNFYNMTVELYGTVGGVPNVLLEKQTLDISPVYGAYFDIPSISLDNIRDGNIAQSVYDLTYVTGSLQIPPGASTTATTLTSQLRFIFENYNANDATNVFKNDLGTGLKQGDEVGCVIKSGIVALEGKRIVCILHIGTNSTDKPMITILNYNYINAGTTIKVAFGGIQSLNEVNVNTISMSVLIRYTDINSSTYLYMPTPTLPDPTNNTVTTISDRNVLGYNWLSYWDMTCAFSGSNLVRQPTTFSFSIRVPYWYPYSGFQYSSVGAQSEFILLKFSPKYIIDPYNAITITCPLCSEVQVFYATGIVRFRHTRSISGSGYFTFTFNTFPSSAYTVSAIPVYVNAEIYSGYRLYAYKNMTISSRTVEKCTLFNFGVLSVSSLNGGQIGVTYTFSLITNHYIPVKGAVSITIPQSYGNMVSNGVTCSLVGFETTNAYCLIQTPSRVDIYLNGSQLSKTSTYKVILTGLQNPNQDSSSLIFYASSYYDENIYLGRKICENSVTPPTITVKAVRVCTLSWSASYVNRNFNASYTFVLSCNDLFRGDSILYIRLPSEFSSNNTRSSVVCSSLESTTLYENKCYLSYINGTFTLWTKLQATSQTSLTLLVNLVNPTNNTYSSSAIVQSKGIVYAEAQPSYLTILSSSYSVASSSSAFLMNSPKEAGLMATYVFKIAPISNYTPNNLGVEFPSNFYIKSSELSVGLTTSNISNLFTSLSYNNVQKIISNISSVNGVSLKSYPTFKVQSNVVHLSNISSVLSNTEWTYLFIRGIKNPSEYLALNFTLTYYIDSITYRTLQWFYQSRLTYYISSPPQYLSIDSVTVSDYDLLYPSVYTFKFNGATGNNIAAVGKQYSYIIVIPTFYKSTAWANGQLVCRFAQLSANSPCQNYQSQIIVTQTFAANFNSLTLSITTLLNPSLQTYCNTDDVTLLEQTFFRIRIIEVISNKFLYQSSSVVDSSNCLKFYSIRIPISLEHPLVMVAGLAYNITYGITKPASNLKIKAKTTANGFSFSPDTVQFNDYYSLKKSATIYLRSDIAPGTYTINFDKFETETRTYFRNILPATIQVISSSSSTDFIAPTITIPSQTVSTSGAPVVIPILFSLPSSTEMTLFIKISQESNQTLAQYSPHLSNFSLTPRIISIIPKQNNFSFTITQGSQFVPPPITLTFTLTSVYTIIHNLTTPTLTLCFDQDPRYDVLYPPLRVRLTQFASSCNLADVGKKITNTLISNSSSESSATSMKPQIIKITSSNIMSSFATLSINTRTEGTLYYLCIDSGYPIISDASSIVAFSNTKGFTGTVTSVAQTVYTSNTAQINYIGAVNITGLSSLTAYNFYAVLQTQLGTSQIKVLQFKTIALSKGVLMKLTFNSIVQNLDIVKSLQRIIRITPLRIKVLTSTYELTQIQNSANQFKNAAKYVYQVIIAPDPTNDTTTPLNIVEGFLNNTVSKDLFKQYLPNWDNTANVQYYELRSVKPRVTTMPKPKVINLYNVTFQMKFWERANIYAIIVEQSDKAEDTIEIASKQIKAVRVSELSATDKARCPSSLQVRYGKNIDNSATTAYKKYTSITDEKGNGVIFFNDLKPGSIYEVFITSSSYLPYEPTLLWEDSEVIKIRFETLYNPNLMKSNRHIEDLKKYQPGLASAIDRFVQNQQKRDKKSTVSNQ